MSGAVSNKLLLYADDSAILVADKCVSNMAGNVRTMSFSCEHGDFCHSNGKCKVEVLTLTTKKLLVISLIQCHFDYARSFLVSWLI